ncbi:MAG: MBL fold metallo-hydrolase [Candidatus Bathyarchaeia archaeon]|jgi:glyoxylase-like metal-dependent hydrolase (beta-lactamase superfamily II)
MANTIKPLSFNGVNAYLIQAPSGYFLIDTGFSKNRQQIETELQKAGCTIGTLKLIILTHGDFDHSGNAAYLHQKCAAPVAMHPLDAGMVESGDMFSNRGVNAPTKLFGKLVLVLLRSTLKKEDRFKPDISLEDNYSFAGFGLDAKVICIPGHSKGSIGVLTKDGDLFCGDLLQNTKRPEKGSLIVDKAAFEDSLLKLRGLHISRVYPGHGKDFLMEQVT